MAKGKGKIVCQYALFLFLYLTFLKVYDLVNSSQISLHTVIIRGGEIDSSVVCQDWFMRLTVSATFDKHMGFGVQTTGLGFGT